MRRAMQQDPTAAAMRHEVILGRVVRSFFPRPGSLWDMFLSAADKYADEDAILWEPDGRLSYRDLRERATALGNAFAALGIVPGDRIATLMGNRPEYTMCAL